jgi:hypothetical protein
MKALILCAGHGKRLRPLTYFKPKCMVKVDGKPVLEHLADHLNSFGITEIMVNLHHLPLSIMKYFGNRFTYTYESELLGEEGTIDSVRSWFKNEYLVVMNGDTLTNLDIDKMFKFCFGINSRYVDKGVYAGTRIIVPNYNTSQKEWNYSDPDAHWYDIGTFKGLCIAKKKYEKIS